MKILSKFKIGLISFCIGALSACSPSTQKEEAINNENDSEVAETLQEDSAETISGPVSKWTYEPRINDLTDEVVGLTAFLMSDNDVEYTNGYTTKLGIGLIYNSEEMDMLQKEVVIGFVDDKLGTCQFSDVNGSGFLARFDDGPIDETWSLVDMARNGKGLVIYDKKQYKTFIDKLKKSKKVKIQVRLANRGMKTFEFSTEGLEWDIY